MKRRHSDEESIHRAIVEWLRAVLVDAKAIHIPNGGKRGKAEAGRLKAMGVMPGVPDLMILRRGVCRFIEIKTATGNLSPEQKAFRDFCVGNCFDWALCRSVDQVRATLEMWRIPTREAGR